MEFGPFLSNLPYTVTNKTWFNLDYTSWLNDNPNVAYEFAAPLVYTLPGKRQQYYSYPSFQEIKNKVTQEISTVVDAFAFYPENSAVMLLDSLQSYENSLLVLGLVFNIIMILFIIISILLVFSLLMNSVEQKSFENGIMRLVGLTKYDYMAMIITQAFIFVLPSIILGYLVSIPLLWYGFTHLLSMESGQTSIIPDGSATAQAIFVGFFIPLASSIIPIHSALNKQLVESLDINRSKTSGTKITITDAKS